MVEARLPPELEQVIFVHAFQNVNQSPSDLFLVARRVREWLVPIAFRVVIFHKHRIFPLKFDRLAQFVSYGSHIKALLLSRFRVGSHLEPSVPSLIDFLAQCPNITDLALWWESPPIGLDTLLNLSQLTHLSIDIHHLLQLDGVSKSTQLSLFPNITHLDTIRSRELDQNEKTFIQLAHHFPALTHIAFLWGSELHAPILRNCESIRAVVSWRRGDLGLDVKWQSPIEDDRIVMMLTLIRPSHGRA
ncbi:hypothetical protein BDN72DRAFT_903614 [Pluteus cervinus]|uniref:Uncharacterized protein n=1 Tax=Pluteus cervinus TaxID=181527 RepID=A0ACD3A8V2_9AGAR|nr:hypothetical protein BDN72DRAFT_903614 [Pluteus cervinus]